MPISALGLVILYESSIASVAILLYLIDVVVSQYVQPQIALLGCPGERCDEFRVLCGRLRHLSYMLKGNDEALYLVPERQISRS